MGTQETKGQTPKIDQWIGATLAAFEAGIWTRPEGLVYAGVDELLAKHGRAFEWDGTDDLPDGVERGQLGECYMNAGRVAIGERYRYVEGYALGCAIPVRHARLIDEHDKVIEPTWRLETQGEEREYFGLIIPAERLREVIHRRGVWGLLDDHSFYTEEWRG